MTAGSRLFSNGPTQIVSTNVGSVQLPFSGVNSSLTALAVKDYGQRYAGKQHGPERV